MHNNNTSLFDLSRTPIVIKNIGAVRILAIFRFIYCIILYIIRDEFRRRASYIYQRDRRHQTQNSAKMESRYSATGADRRRQGSYELEASHYNPHIDGRLQFESRLRKINDLCRSCQVYIQTWIIRDVLFRGKHSYPAT